MLVASVGPDGRIYAAACAEQLLIDAVTGKGAPCPVPRLYQASGRRQGADRYIYFGTARIGLG